MDRVRHAVRPASGAVLGRGEKSSKAYEIGSDAWSPCLRLCRTRDRRCQACNREKRAKTLVLTCRHRQSARLAPPNHIPWKFCDLIAEIEKNSERDRKQYDK